MNAKRKFALRLQRLIKTDNKSGLYAFQEEDEVLTEFEKITLLNFALRAFRL